MSNEWYTPSKYIEAARQVMGSIDLDPASCELANQTVKATRYYTQEENGLMQPWYGNVWLNPPYGKTDKGYSNIRAFSSRLLHMFEGGYIDQAIILILADTSTSVFHRLLSHPVCLILGRPSYSPGSPLLSSPAANNGRRPHCFFYLGHNNRKFAEVFSQFGSIAIAVHSPVKFPIQAELFS